MTLKFSKPEKATEYRKCDKYQCSRAIVPGDIVFKVQIERFEDIWGDKLICADCAQEIMGSKLHSPCDLCGEPSTLVDGLCGGCAAKYIGG